MRANPVKNRPRRRGPWPTLWLAGTSMRSPLFSALALVIAAFCAAAEPAVALTAHIPADYATIQAALNAGATTIYVADGVYPEVLSVTHDLTLLPDSPAVPQGPVPYPRVTGMDISSPLTSITVYVRGFQFLNEVTQNIKGASTIEGCRLDGGFRNGGDPLEQEIHIRSCIAQGEVFVYAYYQEITGNVVIGGAVTGHSNGGTGAIIRDNLVYGSPGTGISSPSFDTPGTVTDNRVTGGVTGYVFSFANASGNVAQDCSGAGYTNNGPGSYVNLQNNVARRCGGAGIDLNGTASTITLNGNTVDTVGTAGIHVGSGITASAITNNVVLKTGGHGLWIEDGAHSSTNQVLHAGGDGIHSNGRVDASIAGRNVGSGIVASEARHNTSYLNSNSGFVVTGTASITISNNIAHGNSRYGLDWTGTGAPTLSCNDWFSNTLGATHNVAAGGTDLAVNPLFCDLPLDLVTLSASSPVLNAAGCGLIGAQGQGCLVATSVGPGGSVDVALAVRPNPARGAVDVAFGPSSQAGAIEIFDLAGARRYHATVEAGARSLRWAGVDDRGLAVPAGVYFLRREAGGHAETTRIVLAR